MKPSKTMTMEGKCQFGCIETRKRVSLETNSPDAAFKWHKQKKKKKKAEWRPPTGMSQSPSYFMLMKWNFHFTCYRTYHTSHRNTHTECNTTSRRRRRRWWWQRRLNLDKHEKAVERKGISLIKLTGRRQTENPLAYAVCMLCWLLMLVWF